MKTFEQFENIDEKEKLFLQLAHLDNLDIKFDFIEYKYELFYIYKDNCLFYQEKKSKCFYINFDKIWEVFENKFSLNYKKIQKIMNGMVKKHFKLKGYKSFIESFPTCSMIEKHFRNNIK